jgi:hypothetical protein
MEKRYTPGGTPLMSWIRLIALCSGWHLALAALAFADIVVPSPDVTTAVLVRESGGGRWTMAAACAGR